MCISFALTEQQPILIIEMLGQRITGFESQIDNLSLHINRPIAKTAIHYIPRIEPRTRSPVPSPTGTRIDHTHITILESMPYLILRFFLLNLFEVSAEHLLRAVDIELLAFADLGLFFYGLEDLVFYAVVFRGFFLGVC